MKDNLIIYVSSRNNYDMLSGEVLKNIKFEGFEFICVDDKSCEEEVQKGKKICKERNIVFLENQSRGVQMATWTLIDFINRNRPNCKFIICFQHDIYPISQNFFTQISEYIEQKKLEDFGIIGFNVLDMGDYTGDVLQKYDSGEDPLGMIGMAHLSIKNNITRWLCPKKNSEVISNEKWKLPFIIEFPMWAAVGINVDLWNKHIYPTTDYQFHLWLPDIAMQFNRSNCPCLVIPNLYCLNTPEIKEKYNLNRNSATGAKNGDEFHFGEYGPHLENWIMRWGWDYENVSKFFNLVRQKYEDTLICEYYDHDISLGPLKNIEL